MIICIECKTELRNIGEGFECPSCGVKAERKDGIVDFCGPDPGLAEGYNEDCFRVDYERSDRCFWFAGRNGAALRIFKRYVASGARIIELGCGAGQTLGFLGGRGLKIEGGDVFRAALEYSRKKFDTKYYCIDIRRLPFREEFDAAGMFDVLEHIDDEALALENARGALKSGGVLVLTVPALRGLWSRHDEVLNHHRRYHVPELRKLLEENGFRVLKISYLFFLFLPFMYFERVVLSPRRRKTVKDDDYLERELRQPGAANSFFGALAWLESLLLPYINLPLGSTIIAAARKK